MYILGLTTLGDSAAAIIKDGELIAAVEEERFSRKKHHFHNLITGKPVFQPSTKPVQRDCIKTMSSIGRKRKRIDIGFKGFECLSEHRKRKK